MKSLQMSAALALLGTALGCPGTDEPGGTDVGSSSSSSDASSTGVATAPLTTAASSSGSTSDAADSGSSSGFPASSSSGGFASGSGSSTGPGCELGTLDCACDRRGACEGDRVCVDNVCELPANCPQERSEPNNEEGDAPDLGEFNDFDPTFETVDGRLPGGADDEDWFSYQCDDNPVGQVDMAYEIDTNIPVRVCQFFLCDEPDNPVVTCPESSEAATSPNGLPGCCSEQTELVVEEIVCNADSDETGRIFVRVDMPLQDMCVSYDLGVHC
ncbi:MAG: hypothetical protein KUG77_02065 [Nannocystaceae bacterium]|nr:hypothetical protein [Nannocystaceae bacterium]